MSDRYIVTLVFEDKMEAVKAYSQFEDKGSVVGIKLEMKWEEPQALEDTIIESPNDMRLV